MGELFRRLRYLLDRRRFDHELAADLEFHREMAARQGRRNLGNELRLREQSRDAWGWTWLDRIGQDLRYAARVLRKSPGFTAAAILMLALGIGVNVAVFGFFDLIVLRPLNVRDPATLRRFHRRSAEAYAYDLPYSEVSFFSAHSRTLSAALALNTTKLAVEGEQKQMDASFVTANFFSDLGAVPRLGRLFDPFRDGAPDAEPVVVLAQGFWERHFGSDPSVIGQTIRLNGKPATIAGVAASDFSGLYLGQSAIWVPITQQPYFVYGSRLLAEFAADSGGVRMWGRLRPGLPPAAAETELRTLAARFHAAHPNDTWAKESLPSDPGGYAASLLIGDRSGTGSEGQPEVYPIFVLLAALGLLILTVACTNLGSLLMARGVAREREIAIRTAVGAGRARLVRQLFTESLLLASLGSAAGLATGYIVLRSLMAITDTPAWLNPAPDWRVTVFALTAGFVSAVLFGLTPAFQVVRRRHRANVARQFLVAAQVAASCVLLIVAGLLGRALEHATSSDPGFDYQHVISIDPGLDRDGYSPARAQAYLDTLRARLRALPGVESVSLAQSPPLGHRTETAGLTLDGRTLSIQINRVDPDFFETMRIPLLRGRNLQLAEPRAIVVGESLARRAWPGQDPLGKQFTLNGDYTVAGIVGTARVVKLQDSDSVEIYFPLAPDDLPSASVIVKTAGAPEGLLRPVAAAAKAVDPNTFPDVELLKSGFRRRIEGARTTAVTVTALGLLADLLACLGIVGVVGYAVSQRTKEIGIRMALGARPAHILPLILTQFSRPVAVGLLAGTGGAAALSRLLRGQLYGISNLDAAAYIGAIGLFVATAAVSVLWPARQALHVDPLEALRHE